MYDIKKKLECKCSSRDFSILDQRNTDIDLGNGTINLTLDVKCDQCGNVARELVEAIIVDIRY